MCPILVYVPILSNKASPFQNTLANNQLIKNAGISEYVVTLPMIEDDASLFSDPNHMSAKGREKWTNLLLDEISNKRMCGIKKIKDK
jgi:lysophospholipase L1-like esterase